MTCRGTPARSHRVFPGQGRGAHPPPVGDPPGSGAPAPQAPPGCGRCERPGRRFRGPTASSSTVPEAGPDRAGRRGENAGHSPTPSSSPPIWRAPIPMDQSRRGRKAPAARGRASWALRATVRRGCPPWLTSAAPAAAAPLCRPPPPQDDHGWWRRPGSAGPQRCAAAPRLGSVGRRGGGERGPAGRGHRPRPPGVAATIRPAVIHLACTWSRPWRREVLEPPGRPAPVLVGGAASVVCVEERTGPGVAPPGPVAVRACRTRPGPGTSPASR